VNSSVYEVKKVREDIGIISTGWDREWKMIVINNTDAGIAKSLMKVALEWERRFSGFSMKMILFVFLALGGFLFLAYFSYYKFFPTTSHNISELPTLTNTGEVVSFVPVNVQNIWTGETSENTQNSDSINIDFERYKMQSEFEKESMILEMQKRDLEISKLQTLLSWEQEKNSRNEKIIWEKDIEIESLKTQIWEYKKKDFTKDAFFIELWKKIDEECRKNGSTACKDLYYNFIQSNQ
jgi:hypothetical protein